MAMWFVYMVRCTNGALYVGCSSNVEKRVETHNKGSRYGGSKYTNAHRPVELVWKKQCFSKAIAMSEERKLKNAGRAVKLKLLADNVGYIPSNR